jgi:signal transduction histidine kinase
MRLLPNSLLGRLVLIFVAGLTATLVLMLIAQTPDRELANFRICAGRAAHRLADFLKLTDQLPVASRDKLAEVAQARGVRMSFAAQPAVASVPEAGSYQALFREVMLDDLRRDRPIAADVKPLEHIAPEPGQPGATDGFDFKVQAPLADGTWVALEVQEPRRLSRWPMRLLTNLLTMVVVMSLLSFVAVRWVTRPLHRLADAAEALGRDINRPPLPEKGPLEVRRAAKAFNSMQERLARYIRNRTGILTAMSHDLKTPITRLRLRAELLEQPELREKFVRDLSEMEHMVNSTLGFMRGLDDREPLRRIDVRALAGALQADAEELGFAVRVLGEPLSPFFGKPEALKRALQNLLDNALRYGRDAEVAIEDQADVLTLVVRDHGPGIPEAELERVFEPFYRLEASRNLGTGGTGLGLSIARNIAQSMGGELSLRNREAGGLEARLSLPRTKRGSASQTQARSDVEEHWSEAGVKREA